MCQITYTPTQPIPKCTCVCIKAQTIYFTNSISRHHFGCNASRCLYSIIGHAHFISTFTQVWHYPIMPCKHLTFCKEFNELAKTKPQQSASDIWHNNSTSIFSCKTKGAIIHIVTTNNLSSHHWASLFSAVILLQ